MRDPKLSFFIVFSSLLCFSIAYAGKTGFVFNKEAETKHMPVSVTKPKPFLGKVTHSFQSPPHSFSPRAGSREEVVYIETIQFRNVSPDAFHSNNSSNFSHGSVSHLPSPFHNRDHKFRKHHHHRKHIYQGSHSNTGGDMNSGGNSNSGGGITPGGSSNSNPGGKSNPPGYQGQSTQQAAGFTQEASAGIVGNGNSSSPSKGSIDRCRIDSNGVYVCDTRRMSME